jgi:hypothetical protein
MMRRLFFLLLLSILGCSGVQKTSSDQIVPSAASVVPGEIMLFSDFENLFPITKYSGNPIIPYTDVVGNWKGNQVEEPCILEDPYDSTRLIMFYSGAPLGGGVASIGRATALKSDPFTWTDYGSNPILQIGASGQWDHANIRLDCVIYDPVADEFKMYYTGGPTGSGEGIGLATSPGNDGINFTKHAGNPVLTYGTGETTVSQSAVLRLDATTWYMYYSYRNGGTVLPGIKLAHSSDGISWTKDNIQVLTHGADGTYDSTYIEWHQILKLDDKFVLIYECYGNVGGVSVYQGAMASCSTYNGTFVKSSKNPIVPPSPSGWDNGHTGTQAAYYINGQWYLYYQGTTSGYYNDGKWSMGAATITTGLSTTTPAPTTTTSPGSTTTSLGAPVIEFTGGSIIVGFDETPGGALEINTPNGIVTLALGDTGPVEINTSGGIKCIQ